MKLSNTHYSKRLSITKFLTVLGVLLAPLLGSAGLKEGRYFQVITGNDQINRDLWYTTQDQKIELVASRIIRSKDYAYDLGESIVFYGDRLDPEGFPIPEAIALIPEDSSRLLLLFSKLPETDVNGLSYKVFVLKDDTEDFPFGSFKFINTSSKNTAINLGGERFLLQLGATQTIEIEPPEMGDLSIEILAKDSKKKGWASYYSNGWGHRINLRTLVFILDSPNEGLSAIRYRQFEPERKTPSIKE